MKLTPVLMVVGLSFLAAGCSCCKPGEGKAASQTAFRNEFTVDKSALAATGANSYFPLRPGAVLKLADGNERLTLTVLTESRTIDGAAVAVLEEREEVNGQLKEISRNFFATDPNTHDVYYFGEEVDNYKDGKIVNHDSAWISGKQDARFGLMMPGTPREGDGFYQEIAPKVALDRARIVSVSETVRTPAGTFSNCVHFVETTPLERGESHKYFAPGVGLVKDDNFELSEKP